MFRQLAKIVYFVACADMRDICDYAYGAIREIGAKFFDDGNDRVATVGNGEDDLIFRIIQATEAGKILVGFMV